MEEASQTILKAMSFKIKYRIIPQWPWDRHEIFVKK